MQNNAVYIHLSFFVLAFMQIHWHNDQYGSEAKHLKSNSMSVFEHITQEFLHWCVSDGPLKEKLLDSLRAHKIQRWKEEQKSAKPEKKESNKCQYDDVYLKYLYFNFFIQVYEYMCIHSPGDLTRIQRVNMLS